MCVVFRCLDLLLDGLHESLAMLSILAGDDDLRRGADVHIVVHLGCDDRLRVMLQVLCAPISGTMIMGLALQSSTKNGLSINGFEAGFLP